MEPRTTRLDAGTQLGPGMSAGTGMKGIAVVGTLREEDKNTSALGEDFGCTPTVVPTRAHLDVVKRLQKGDLYIGRRSKQRSLPKSRYCNNCKVAECARDVAITKFREMLIRDDRLYTSLWTLSGRRLICHCRATERCHADVLIEQFRESFPDAYDRSVGGKGPPEPRVLAFMAKLREEPESDEGSTPDDDAPGKFAGHRGGGEPMKVGVGYTQRELCDGQSLASPGRWAPGSRVYPETAHWKDVCLNTAVSMAASWSHPCTPAGRNSCSHPMNQAAPAPV